MKITRRQIRRTIIEAMNSSLGSVENSKALQDYIFSWCQMVDRKYGEITVDDVLELVQADVHPEVGDFQIWKYVSKGSLEADFILNCDYDDIVNIMWKMVKAGSLSDGYEDFFKLGGTK